MRVFFLISPFPNCDTSVIVSAFPKSPNHWSSSMAHEVSLKRAHSEEFDVNKRQRTSVDHTPLFFTIHGQLEADEGRSSAVQIAELLSTNQDILIPFQQSSIREIRRQFRDLSKGQELGKKEETKLITITNKLYEYALRNSPISQILPVRNGELDTLQNTLSKDIRTEAASIKREVRIVLRELRSIDIDTLDLPGVQAYLSTLLQLSIKFSPILDLKKCSEKDDNTRMHDLAAAYKREGAAQQFPRILSDYPEIVKQVIALESVFNGISETMKEIKEFSIPLYKKQAELVQPKARPQIEEQVLIPFGQVVYPAAAQCLWQVFRNSASQNNDPKLIALFGSGALASPIPENLDYAYCNKLWSLYFSEPHLEDLGFEEWMTLVLKEIEPEQLSLLCTQLQVLAKTVTEINESKDISKPDRELLTSPYHAEMMERTLAQFQGVLSNNQRTLAEVHLFLTAKSMK